MSRRRAVVTGGGTGIGRATAERLLATGTEVLLVGRRPDVLAATAAALGDGATWHAADLGDPDQVDALAARLDRLGVLVANAGASAARPGPGSAGQAEVWLATFRVNVLSTVLLAEAVLPLLTAQPGGRVVAVGSRAALTGGASPAYVAAKAALHGWVLSTAARVGPLGGTANLVAPGYTAGTELVAGRIPPDRHDALLRAIAAGRPGTTDEIAAAITFLASPDASYVNGQVLSVDGGVVPPGT